MKAAFAKFALLASTFSLPISALAAIKLETRIELGNGKSFEQVVDTVEGRWVEAQNSQIRVKLKATHEGANAADGKSTSSTVANSGDVIVVYAEILEADLARSPASFKLVGRPIVKTRLNQAAELSEAMGSARLFSFRVNPKRR